MTEPAPPPDAGVVPDGAASVRAAQAALEAGDLTRAAGELDAAAEAHGRAGDADGRARLLTQAAVLLRAAGRPGDAGQRARTAWDVATAWSTKRAAAVEVAEAAAMAGAEAEAAAWFRRATAPADDEPMERARLLLKLANIETSRRSFSAAVGAAGEAARVLDGAGRPDGAMRARLEMAGGWLEGGNPEQAERVVGEVVAWADDAGDHALLSEAHLVLLSVALARDDHQAADACAVTARAEALAAGAALPYLTAASAAATLADGRGDRIAAYASLATAWVTLGDLVGRESARAMVEPVLLGMRDRWGADGFEAAKNAYESRRRAALGR
jgi:tetratricopeptide (TPR) repeat protein